MGSWREGWSSRSSEGTDPEEAGQREDHPGDRGCTGRGRRHYPAVGGRDENGSERKFDRIE